MPKKSAKKKTQKNVGGRPLRKEFNWESLEHMCSLRLSLEDCAELMQCDSTTIQNKIRKKYDQTFSEYRNQKLAVTRRSLIETALKQATERKNTVMLIFCLKNLCGWVDKYDSPKELTPTGNNNNTKLTQNITLNYNLPSNPNKGEVVNGEAKEISTDND